MTATLLLLLLFRSALEQDQWRMVYQGGTIEAVWGVPTLTADQRSRLQAGWAWSATRPPRRVTPKQLGKEKGTAGSARLQVRVERQGGSRQPEDARVVAAPVAMWREIPEGQLPSWPVPKGGRLELPLDPTQRWRLRVAGSGEGSWWVDVPPGRTAVVLTPTPASGIEIAVSRPGGEPAAPVTGAVLESGARQGRNRAWASFRGEEGRISFPGLPDREEVTLPVFHLGDAPATLSGRPSELPGRLRLGAGGSLAGRVVDPSRLPLAGAKVQVEAWVAPGLPQLTTFSARSGADGAWTLAGVPPGAAVLRVSLPGRAVLQQPLTVTAGRTDLGDLALPRGTALAVRAVDEQGEPVAGATVSAGPGVTGATDAQGLARLDGLAEAPVEIRANASGHLPGLLRLNPPLPIETSIAMPRAFTVRGRLVDEMGRGVPEGTVRIEQPGCHSEEHLEDDGRFTFDLRPGEPATLFFRSPSTGELRITAERGQPGEVRDWGDLRTRTGLVVTGRVVGSADGAPVAGARVWLPRPGPEGPVMAWASRDLLEAASETDGRFRLGGLTPAPAPVLLRVEASGFARNHLNVTLPGSGDPPAVDLGDVPLSRGATLRVLVPPADEAADAPAEVVARVDLRNEWQEPDMLTAAVAEGVATFMHLPAGPVTVSVLAGRKLLCERAVDLAGEGTDTEVDCQRSGLIVRGTVRVGGAPAGPGVLIWQRPSVGTSSRIETTVSPGGLRRQGVFGLGRPQVDVPVAADGSFATAELTPGAWQVSWVPELGSVTGTEQVQIPSGGEAVQADVSFPGLAVEGMVEGEDGQPVAGARVGELTGGAMAIAAPDGSFVISGVAAGHIALQARLAERSSPVVELDLAADHEPAPVILRLGEHDRPKVTVRVTATDGAPVAGAFVFLEEEGKGQRILTTDTAGDAVAAVEAPLPVRVRAAATAGDTWAFGPWVPWNQARAGLAVELGAAGVLTVVSAHAEGMPQIAAPGGWNLTALLLQVGMRPFLAPDRPLRLAGLPSGLYTVSLNGSSQSVSVRGAEAAEARFP